MGVRTEVESARRKLIDFFATLECIRVSTVLPRYYKYNAPRYNYTTSMITVKVIFSKTQNQLGIIDRFQVSIS
jgi:hypothetical protein